MEKIPLVELPYIQYIFISEFMSITNITYKTILPNCHHYYLEVEP